jgi:hypothetical protein
MSSAVCREENEKTTETGEFVPVVKGPHIYSEWCPARLCVTLLLLYLHHYHVRYYGAPK